MTSTTPERKGRYGVSVKVVRSRSEGFAYMHIARSNCVHIALGVGTRRAAHCTGPVNSAQTPRADEQTERGQRGRVFSQSSSGSIPTFFRVCLPVHSHGMLCFFSGRKEKLLIENRCIYRCSSSTYTRHCAYVRTYEHVCTYAMQPAFLWLKIAMSRVGTLVGIGKSTCSTTTTTVNMCACLRNSPCLFAVKVSTLSHFRPLSWNFS